MSEPRMCIGSAKFGIEAHDASVDDFPKQPSQKDGLGRMCRSHWNQYTTALRKAALAHKVIDSEADTGPAATEAEPEVVATAEGTRAPRARRHAGAVAEVAQEPSAG